jgi:hypothetical protein
MQKVLGLISSTAKTKKNTNKQENHQHEICESRERQGQIESYSGWVPVAQACNLATQEAGIRRIEVPNQPWANSS